MQPAELKQLEERIGHIVEIARDMGLDFYEMRYEICPAEVIYTIGAYGMPFRFSHWSFGKSFHRLKMQYDYNLSRIYELVINSDPCYAFLLDGNSLLENQVIAAHVLAHSDFFKNNAHFAHTSPQMMDSMAAASERIRGYEYEFGRERVEETLDAALALQEQIDPYHALRDAKERNAPDRLPTEDVLGFIAQYAPYLDDWQRDIVLQVRNEMHYFWPQMATKVMNEGWASFWHARIVRQLDLTSAEALDFARMNAAVLAPSRHQINPYWLGYKIFEAIEKEAGTTAYEKLFEIREMDNDVSFVRNYLTRELVEELDLFLYQRGKRDWEVVETQWEAVRDGLVNQLTRCGTPTICVLDGDYGRNGELYLIHQFDDRELDVKYIERTLPHVVHLWGRAVHLETVHKEQRVVYTGSLDGSVRRR